MNGWRSARHILKHGCGFSPAWVPPHHHHHHPSVYTHALIERMVCTVKMKRIEKTGRWQIGKGLSPTKRRRIEERGNRPYVIRVLGICMDQECLGIKGLGV